MSTCAHVNVTNVTREGAAKTVLRRKWNDLKNSNRAS